MTPSVRIIGDTRVIAHLRQAPTEGRARLQESVGRLALALRRKVSRDKLAGQVLRMRSGTLTRSIDWNVVANDREVVGAVFTNVEYAARHEYGFQGTETVKAHLRTIKKAWGKTLRAPLDVQVNSHSRKVDYPARSFLRSSLVEMQDEIVAEMTTAVMEGFK